MSLTLTSFSRDSIRPPLSFRHVLKCNPYRENRRRRLLANPIGTILVQRRSPSTGTLDQQAGMIDDRDLKSDGVGDLRPYLQMEQSQQVALAGLYEFSAKESLPTQCRDSLLPDEATIGPARARRLSTASPGTRDFSLHHTVRSPPPRARDPSESAVGQSTMASVTTLAIFEGKSVGC